MRFFEPLVKFTKSMYFFLSNTDIVDDEDVTYGGNALCTSMSKRDTELADELTEFNIQSLYDKFYKKEVTVDIVWDLNDQLLEDIGLTPLEKLKYTKAKEKYNIKQRGKCSDSFKDTKDRNKGIDFGNAFMQGDKEMTTRGKY